MWHDLQYRQGSLYYDGADLSAIAQKHGTPLFVYSRTRLESNYRLFEEAFGETPHVICYAVKANSSLGVLKTLANLGSGADVVSGGEIVRAGRAGIPANRIIYSGVGKTDDEIDLAIDQDILLFNVESQQELERVNALAGKRGKKAGLSIRVNPDIDAKTHPKITTGMQENKFGIPAEEVIEIYTRAKAMPNIEIRGIEAHIGSQIADLRPFNDMAERLRSLWNRLQDLGIDIRYVSLGGGLGIPYRPEAVFPSPKEYAATVLPHFRGAEVTLLVEPGRFIVGNAGVFLTRVLYTKQNGAKNFVIVDGAMNDFPRPMLYDAHHTVYPVQEPGEETEVADIVGPICETTDRLAKSREIPVAKSGDLLAFTSAGAYCFSMSSNYNSRPRPAEIMIEKGALRVIRKRETTEDLMRGESLP
jgi:diaminopimelate decarboxylase